MNSGLPPEVQRTNLEKLRTFVMSEAFLRIDKYGDGNINTAQLGTVCAQLLGLGKNPTEEELQGMMREVDPDGTGVINFQRFLNLMGRKKKVSTWLMAEVPKNPEDDQDDEDMGRAPCVQDIGLKHN